jgi:hypothetical protein
MTAFPLYSAIRKTTVAGRGALSFAAMSGFVLVSSDTKLAALKRASE